MLPLLSVCCLPCSDAAAVPREHKLPAAVNESDCFAPIIDQTKAQPLSHPQLIGDECSAGTTASREQLIVILLLIIIMILWLNDQHLYDADHAVTPQPSASFTKGFTNDVSEPKSIIMTWLLRVMGKRKIRIILNRCCNKTFCLSKYSEYPVGPAGTHHRTRIYQHDG